MIFLEMSGNRICFDEAFQIKDNELLKIYIEIWDKISIIINKEFNVNLWSVENI